MRRLVRIACLVGVAAWPVHAWAQAPQHPQQPPAHPQPPPQQAQPPAGDDGEGDEEEGDEGEEPSLRPPSLEPIELGTGEGTEGEGHESEGDGAQGDEDLPNPGEALDRLEEGAPGSSDPTQASWTAPQTTFTLHGYFRVRPELWDTFFLGRGQNSAGRFEEDLPFTRFRPPTRSGAVAGGCTGDGDPMSSAPCDSSGTLAFANTRLRLEPSIALSDDVSVHAQIDVFDNLVLGSTPDGFVTQPSSAGTVFERQPRTPRVPLDSFAATQAPPTVYRNSLSDSIVARRAWAEVTNRGLGQLRFGRMGSQWGLGILANAGDGIDQDWQSDADRIMLLTKLFGFYFVAAWDFPSEGIVEQNRLDLLQLDYDVDQNDDVNQWVFAVAHRLSDEERDERLQTGGFVLNGGAYFVYRNQNLTSAGVADPYVRPPAETSPQPLFVRRSAEAFIPDVWVQFLWTKLRVELEAVLIAGSIQNIENDSYVRDDYQILQFGSALEAEYRLLDDKLGISFYTGYASGDADVDGLAVNSGLPVQQSSGGTAPDRTISTFRFNPAYRVDLILFRNILSQISGAYYFKPGLSYDFIRNSFGQLLGARADLIYSRASETRQTWGNDPNLGLEINASLYYRSEDGPDILDGFYAMLQYGILFPFGGLGYKAGDRDHAGVDLSNAQILRLVLGVQY